MIKKILIANRGEVAIRIQRTCREMGIPAVAIYSDADRDALFVREADESVCIGGVSSQDSYLNIAKIITAAKSCGADAIHPGFGFLAENAVFAQAVLDNGLIFIGPTPQTIEQMGNKANAKAIAQQAGVSVIPGYQGTDQNTPKLTAEIKKLGLPCMIKAVAGGGGKGLKQVLHEKDIGAAIDAAKREGLSAFGDDTLIIEKFISSPRHIEIQIFGDRQGHIIHLCERECTLQRRHQKVIEESPSVFLTSELRQKMGEAAIKVAKAVNYVGAGTVEFVVDAKGNFYFLEMNTRLQVEHPVTEMVLKIDIVKLQIETAQGHPLKLSQDQIKTNGHAMEARVYAEDPANGFLPATGRIAFMDLPRMAGVRYDMGVETGSEISIHYDPMLGKIIAHANDRRQCIQLLATTLEQITILGTTTNLWFLQNLITHPDHIVGNFDTGFIDRHLQTFLKPEPDSRVGLTTLCAAVLQITNGPMLRKRNPRFPAGLTGFRITDRQDIPAVLYSADTEIRFGYRRLDPQKDIYEFVVENQSYTVEISSLDTNYLTLLINTERHTFTFAQKYDCVYIKTGRGEKSFLLSSRYCTEQDRDLAGALTAPLPGKVLKVMVRPEQSVMSGETLMIVEAMKMEHPIKANADGKIATIFFKENDTVNLGDILVKLK